jgi:hypothetical protein
MKRDIHTVHEPKSKGRERPIKLLGLFVLVGFPNVNFGFAIP